MTTIIGEIRTVPAPAIELKSYEVTYVLGLQGARTLTIVGIPYGPGPGVVFVIPPDGRPRLMRSPESYGGEFNEDWVHSYITDIP